MLTPLYRKLGIKEGARVKVVGAPASFAGTLGDLPAGVELVPRARSRVNVAVIFVTSLAELERRFPPAHAALEKDGGLWVAWPKKSSPVATDLDFERVQGYGLRRGLVDNKVCAVDETFTALRFVYRLSDR
ncbi:MAG TPA: DUF3052 domain-containing protein [Actinomycetota bacterium]|nr:DUF3052 domain-containing protein [Actinomycetota bacterium]